jgi:hypothetical protein
MTLVLLIFLETLLHQKRLENVGPYPPDSAKNTSKNVQKTFGKRMKNVGLEQPCWAPADSELAWEAMSSQQEGVTLSMNLGRASFRHPISGSHDVFVLRRTHCTQPHSHVVAS